MKEHEQKENVGATAFDLPNDMKPNNYNHIYYGNQHMPHPTNSAAKVVYHEKVMKQVLEAK